MEKKPPITDRQCQQVWRKDTCENCKWWHMTEKEKDKISMGECRQGPPTVFAFYDADNEMMTYESTWPETNANLWCGQHRQANNGAGKGVIRAEVRAPERKDNNG